MLDQNTDRMWFVIGAVIVGAAIIFIANGTLPDIFASVTDSFKESSDKATDVIESMEVYGSGVTVDGWEIGSVAASNGRLLSGVSYPERIRSPYILLEPGSYTMHLNYDWDDVEYLEAWVHKYDVVDGSYVHNKGLGWRTDEIRSFDIDNENQAIMIVVRGKYKDASKNGPSGRIHFEDLKENKDDLYEITYYKR